MTLYNFLNISRKDRPCECSNSRVEHFNEYVKPYSKCDLREQSSRCMDCPIAFCHISCPLNSRISEWNALTSAGNYKVALETLLETNPFPEFTGRVCPAPCEEACLDGVHHLPVSICPIEYSLIEMGFENSWITPKKPSNRTDKKVAIIGSGPSGLSASQHLNQQGHSVTVFEQADKPGGVLMYGIPDFKLEKSIVDRRIQIMKEEGIRFICNTLVGKDILEDELSSEYDVVIYAIGAAKQRDLNIDGRHANGVYFAKDLLIYSTKLNLKIAQDHGISPMNKRIVIIGGGETGSDCLETAIRLQAKSVTQLEILPHPNKNDVEIESSILWKKLNTFLKRKSISKDSNDKIWSTKSVEFLTNEKDKLTGVEVEKVFWSEKDNTYKAVKNTKEKISVISFI